MYFTKTTKEQREFSTIFLLAVVFFNVHFYYILYRTPTVKLLSHIWILFLEKESKEGPNNSCWAHPYADKLCSCHLISDLFPSNPPASKFISKIAYTGL